MKTIQIFSSLFIASLFSMSIAQAGIDVGSKAPVVTLPTLNQGIEAVTTINQAPEKNQKVILEFFSTGCQYCMENMANIREFSAEFAGKAVFRLVGIDRQEKLTRDFAAQNLDFNVVVDSARVAKKAYEVQATPTTFVIDSDNNILFIGVGSWDDAEKTKIREVLNQ